jgi:hypothetical protein
MRRQSADSKVWAGSRDGAVFATQTCTGTSTQVLDRILASPNVAQVVESPPGSRRDDVTGTA